MPESVSAPLKSAVYRGWVTHARRLPREHRFRYRVFMVYLELSELDAVFSRSAFWSLEKTNIATFRRSDYLGDPAVPLDTAVRDEVERQSGRRPDGRITMLSNLRYFGFIINPITCYYCFDSQDRLTHVLAEVTNTPWKQRHAYVIAQDDGQGEHALRPFAKRLHVSPFMPLEMEYRWRSAVPSESLSIYMENHHQGQCQFHASLRLERTELSPALMRNILLAYPFMTARVGLAIYWQALRLWWKRITFHPNPQKLAGPRPAQVSSKENPCENHVP